MKQMILMATLMAASSLLAGNAANPNACELSPIPLPLEFGSDMDRPLAFGAATTVTLACPDAAGANLCWLPELRPQQIERAIRLAAMFKFNYVVIEPWAVFRSEKHPWISWPDAKMTKAAAT